MNADRLVAGKATFKLQVPFKLSSSGSSEDPKPLIVYLHGYGHNITQFEEAVKTFEDFEAYHLFIQGPFPTKIEHQNNKKRGYAWYLYGDQKTYNQHLEMSSEFVQDVIDQHLGHINVSEICVIGYSMGAYLAGYWALTRWNHTNKVIMLSGRFKIEMIKIKSNRQTILSSLCLYHYLIHNRKFLIIIKRGKTYLLQDQEDVVNHFF